MAIYKKRKRLKTERIQLFIDAETKQHLYNAAEHTGTAAAEIIRQAVRKELDENYVQFKDADSDKDSDADSKQQ